MTHSHPKRRTHDLALNAVLALLASLAMAPADAQTAADCITVEVQNVRPQQGHLMAAAYDSAETYGKTPMAVARVPAGDATTRFELCGVHGDSLAIALFQDLDSDGVLGKNLLGMPTEPWGSSGSPGAFGPSWETGKVRLDGTTVVIKLSL